MFPTSPHGLNATSFQDTGSVLDTNHERNHVYVNLKPELLQKKTIAGLPPTATTVYDD